MANYIVSYDLNGPTPTHAEMDEHINRGCVAHGRVLETVWYISAVRSRVDLYNYLKSKLGPEDRLLVVEAIGATWSNLLINDDSLKSQWEADG